MKERKWNRCVVLSCVVCFAVVVVVGWAHSAPCFGVWCRPLWLSSAPYRHHQIKIIDRQWEMPNRISISVWTKFSFHLSAVRRIRLYECSISFLLHSHSLSVSVAFENWVCSVPLTKMMKSIQLSCGISLLWARWRILLISTLMTVKIYKRFE